MTSSIPTGDLGRDPACSFYEPVEAAAQEHFDLTAQGTAKHAISSSFWTPLLIFVLLALGIFTIGVAIFYTQKAVLRHDAQNNLATIADLKTRQISSWRAERLANGEAIGQNPLLVQEVEAWLRSGTPDDARKARLFTFLTTRRQAYLYRKVSLFDATETLWLSTDPGEQSLTLAEQEGIAAAIRTQQVILSDLHKDTDNAEADLDLFTPLLSGQAGNRQVVAVLHLTVDAPRFLFPLLQSWPSSSPSAETLLVQREGDDVLYLSPLRHRAQAAMSLRLPVHTPRLVAGMAVQSGAGLVEGVDYRGVLVVGAVRPVSGTPWFLVAKVDAEELYGPVRRLAWLVGILTGIFLALAAGGVGLWWRQQHARQLAWQYRAALERATLVQHLDYLTKYANDIILLFTPEGCILDVNDRAVETYGYARAELLQLHISALRSAETRALLEEKLREVQVGEGLVYEIRSRSSCKILTTKG